MLSPKTPQLIFGPHTTAQVTITGGVATQVEIFNPGKPGSVIVPAEWACNVHGSRQQILAEVKASLNGATVTAIP